MTIDRPNHKSTSVIARLLMFACLIACAGLPSLFAQAAAERAAPKPISDLGQKAIRRMILGNAFVRHAFGFQPFVRPPVTSDSWLGGSGNWNTAASWSLGTIPGSGNDALITTASSTVQLNVSGAINNLTIGSTDVLNFNNNNALTIDGSTITNSNKTGTGGITFSSVGNNTDLIIGSSAVTLTGGGIVTMGTNTNNRIYGAVAADVLTNANNTIQGSGQIGANQMGLVNESAGIIDANQSAGALTIFTSNGTTNSGTLEATAGGNLILKNDTFTNTGGAILASGTNSVVTLANPIIVGGTLNTSSGGLIQASGNPTLNGVTNSGTYQLPNNNDTTIIGTITNSGTIQQNSVGNLTDLILGGANVTLTGGGTITMDNNSENRIYGAAGADVLTNVNNLIQGSGQIGAADMSLVNQTSGIIDANQATPLTINTSNGTTNTGTLEATSGGTLIFAGIDTYTNTGGTILASGTGSVVSLQGNLTIAGGTLNTAGGGLIQDASGTPTLTGVTNKGTYQVLNNQQTQLLGTLNNQGTIQLNSVGNATELQADGNVTLTGGGAITLSDNTNNYLLQSVANSTMTNVNNTISGSGNIGNGSMAFTNDAGGIVDATSALGNKLTVQTGGVVNTTNLGLMEAGSGGTLQFDNTVINTGGTIEALNGGNVIMNGSTITGGTLTTAGTGVISVQGTAEVNGVTNAGNLQIPNNQTVEFTGTLNNTGTISLNSVGNATELAVNSPTATLSGTGTVTLSDNSQNYILGVTSGNQLTIAQTVQGPAGNIGNGELVITNQSTIDATASIHSNVLTIDPDASFINNGLLEATGGGTLVLLGGTFTNTGATITAGAGSTVDLQNSVDIVGGTLNGAGTFVVPNSAQLDGSASHPVTLASTLEIANNESVAIDGTIKNSGTLELLSVGNATELQVNSATATLQGTGSVTFSDNNQNYILATASGNQLTIAQNITGAGGNVGNGSLVLINQSTIDATASAHGNTLTIQPDGTMSNTGLLEATGGGSLALDGGTFTNTGSGTITAGSGSNVTLEGSVTVTGGTLNGAGLFTSQSGTTLNNLTNAGTLQAPNNTSTTLEGTITNTGTLQVSSGGNNTFLDPSGAVTLTGGGAVLLSDNNDNYLQSAVGGSSLTNVNNTISGSGNIGNGNLAFTNESAGVVDATSTHSNSLTINSGTLGATNTGLWEASSGGNLILNGTVFNTGGTIEALAGTGSNAGGAVSISGATITGGTLNTLGTGVNAGSMTALSSTLSGLTNLGTILLPNNNSLDLSGTIVNNGSIDVNSTGNDTFLYMNGNVTLNGSGTVVLSNSSINFIRGVAGTEILTNNGNTIEGSGAFGSGILGLVNNAGGTVLANQSVALVIDPNASGVTNNGTFQVNTGSVLDITGGPFNNFNSGTGTLTGGTYNVNGGTFQFDNANIVTNAADIILTGAGSQIISNTSANALANFATNAAGGVFQLGAGRSFTTSGAGGGNFTNNGSLIIGGGDIFKVAGALSNFSGTTLTGGSYYVAGTLQFGTSGSTLVTNDANLTLAGGSAKLLDLAGNNLLSAFTTNGSGATFTVAANGSYTTPGSFTNSGTMDVEQSSTLKIAGNLNNHGTVTTNGQNLGGGANTLTVSGTLTNNTGDTVSIGAHNDTSDVANVGLLANSGTVTVGTGATMNLTSAGADTNSSIITLDGGELDVQAGTLTNSTSGTLDLEQKGNLTVAGSLTNSGTLTTNNSNLGGGANTITVAGTFTNSSGATATIGAHGDTTDTASVGLLVNAGGITVDKGASLALTAAGADSNTGSIALAGGTMTVAAAGVFTNSGTLDEETGGNLTVKGSMTNAGTLSTNGSNQGGAANSISVTGTFTNNNGATATIGANNDTSDTASVGLLSNAGAITVDKGASLKLTAAGADSNTGSIALAGGSMNVANGGVFTNSGTLDEETGGKLSVTGNMTNGGTLSTNGSNLGGAANSIAISGKLTNKTGATVTIGANNDTSDKASVGTLANSGTVTVDTGATLTLALAGSDTNTGAIAVSGTVDIDKAITLSGTGALTLTGGAITGVGGVATLTNAGTIQGSGTISNLGITNSGTLSANQAAALTILPTSGGLDNTGTIKVSAGDTMEIGTSAGGSLTNFSGTTLTGGIYNITGTLQFGSSGTTIATNAANITLNGAGKMIDFGSNNILAGFNNNAATGVFTLASSASLATTGGSFTNAGRFTVSAGSTFTVGGSSFNFTQTGGTTTVDGTLTSSTLGTITLNGGSLAGAGTLGDNVVDDSTLTAGDSAAKTGQLKVADTYAQGSSGSLDIEINGATVGTKYDQLKVTQGATLSGTLNIALGSFTPTIGQKFTILTASAVSGTFTTVNGLAINGTEHFTITYNAGSVVLTVVSGALPASNFSSSMLVTQLLHPPVSQGSAVKVHSGFEASGHNLARVPSIRVSGVMRTTPVAAPAFGSLGMGLRGFRPMDSLGSTALATPSAGTGDAGLTGAFGIAPVSAASYNSMSGMNHMRFECGVDLKGLVKTGRKRLIKGLWASPDSPDALYLGYMTYTTSH